MTITKRLERFFILLLFINPFLDVANGLFIYMLETLSNGKFVDFFSQVTPVLVLRMGFLLLFALYAVMVRDKKAILTMIPVGLAWVMSLAGEFLFAGEFSLFTDVQYFAKFVYNLAVLLVYFRVFKNMDLDRKALIAFLNRVCFFTLNALAISLLICYVFGFGYSTYADRFGYFGFRGIFYSGNDITAVFMLLLPFAITAYCQMPKPKSFWHTAYHASASSAALTCTLIIATKTSLLAAVAILVVFFIYGFVQLRKKKNKQILKRLLNILLGILIIMLLLAIFTADSLITNVIESLRHTKTMADVGVDLTTLIISGRQHKLKAALGEYVQGGPYLWLFGIGRGTQEVIIEMDLFEVLCYFGLFGFAAMLWLYAKLGVEFVLRFFKRIDMASLAAFLSLGLCVGYMFIAGHILFSVTSGFYFSFVLLYAGLYLSDNVKKWTLYEKPPQLRLRRRKDR